MEMDPRFRQLFHVRKEANINNEDGPYQNTLVPIHYGHLAPNTQKKILTGLRQWIEFCGEQQPPASGFADDKEMIARFLQWLLNRQIDKHALDPAATLKTALQAVQRLRWIQEIVKPEEEEIAALAAYPAIRAVLQGCHRARADRNDNEMTDLMAQSFQYSTITLGELREFLRACYELPEPSTGLIAAVLLHCGTMAGFRSQDLANLKYSLLCLSHELECKPVPMRLMLCGLHGGKTNKEGTLMFGGFARHKDPLLDAQSTLADLVIYQVATDNLPIISMIESRQYMWRKHRILVTDHGLAYEEQPYHRFCTIIEKVTSRMEGWWKTKKLHLSRASGAVLLAQEGAELQDIQMWGRWARSVTTLSYLYKNPMCAAKAAALLAGYGEGYRNDHVCPRAQQPVPPAWIDAVLPRARQVYHLICERNRAAVNHHKKKVMALVDADMSAQTCLEALLHLGEVFWQTLPYKMRAYGASYSLAKLPAVTAIIRSTDYELFAARVLDSGAAPAPPSHPAPAPALGSALQPSGGRSHGQVMPRIFSKTIKTVRDAYREWKDGIPGHKPVSETLANIPDGFILGTKNRKAKNRNQTLPQVIDAMIARGTERDEAITRMEDVKKSLELTLYQLREGLRMAVSLKRSENRSDEQKQTLLDKKINGTTLPLKQFVEALKKHKVYKGVKAAARQ